MDVNFELYKVFYYVAQTLSFSDASKVLYISQSAVSQSVKALEKKLNKVLFDRSTKKVKLTEEGEILFKHVKSAVELILKGQNIVLDGDKISKGQIRIAADETLIKHYLLPFIEEFHRRYQDINIKLISCDSENCGKILENNHADLVIASSPCGNITGYNVKEIREFRDVFVANKDIYPLEDEIIKLSELVDYPILMLDKDNNSSKYLHSIFMKHSIDLIPNMELKDNDLLLDLAREGLGIAFVPEYCLPKDEEKLITIEMFETLPKRKIIAAYDEESINYNCIKEFMNLLSVRRQSFIFV